ncbi:Ig-like domain-containing protein, partial [Aeromonas hydrophila]|uniref:Ig-like domain-containing protein n=1 Tax=Aeromonas hydrophila TaxID=644 RepID=UPI003D25DE7E
AGFLPSLLTGTIGGQKTSILRTQPSPATQVQVVDGFTVAKPNERTQLDLSAFVRGRGATLTSLTSEQPECGAGNVSGLMAEVDISDTTLCQYRFSARSGSSEGVATLSVLSTLAATPVLEPLSVAMTVSEAPKAFNVVSMYGTNLPSGYALKAGSVVVQGGTAQGTTTDSGNIITYTPPVTPDWNRIQFTLTDPAKPGEDILGTLYVTVSESANQAPTISNGKYNYSAPANTNPAIVTFQGVTLDLANLKNLAIADPEGKGWQLIEVQSYSASVVSAAPNDVTNKKFTFQAGTVGEHIVSYIVGDHEGGYRMGLMSVTVGAKEQAKTWGDIDLVASSLRVYGPPLYSELKGSVGAQLGAFVEPVWDTTGTGNTGNTLGAAGNLAATAYCSGKRLPKLADLEALRNDAGVAAERAKYPQSRPYLISDTAGTAFQTYNLSTGATAAYTPGVTLNPYVICVSDHGLSYVATPNTPFTGMTNTVVSDGSWYPVGTVTSGGGTTSASPTLFGTPTNAGTGSLGAPNFRLNPGSCTGDTCVLEANGAANEYGSATAQIANGVFTGKTLTVPVTFLQNAKVTAASVTTNNQKANGTDANVVTLTLKDNAGNLVPNGTPVKLNYSTSTSPPFTPTITPASGLTVNVNASGQVALNIKSNSVGSVTVNNPSVAGGLPLASTSTTTTFVTPNTAPVASSLTWVTPITASVDEPFILKWTYSDAESDAQSGSTVEWFRNGVSLGAPTATLTANKFVYYPASGLAGATLTAKITPKASTGTATGTTVTSPAITVAAKGSLTGFVSSTASTTVMNWETADNYCKSLNVNGYTGYRLPTPTELQQVFTQVTGVSSGTYSMDLCNIARWPLNSACGTTSGVEAHWSNTINGISATYIRTTNGTSSTYDHSVALFSVCTR